MKRFIAALALAAAFGPAAVAGTAAPLSGDDCILVRDIRNHTVVDQNTMLMEVFGKGVYRVTTAQACFRSAISADPIAFNTRGRERICKASQLGLQARSGYCGAQSIQRLTAEEVAALPKTLKP
ncbi:hypothetical protein [Phenylobacterium sp.]|uniref:hypothetical protein n=1 Tax=Phenylobacterium sp. TaxID=1871053 RepID=UPI001215F54B|nr:hypothetical protein [Phenylobacterium sp.]TAL37674.1 MAG: hypothetical protein EPN98_02700 [Phenylobacterium sp.]